MAINIKLNFNGPFDFEELPKQPNAFSLGVYIWGFEVHQQFLPYYVGKSQDNVVRRIAQHIGDILKPSSTYMRLTAEGMKEYAQNFPVITQHASKSTFPNTIWNRHPWVGKRIGTLTEEDWAMVRKYFVYLNNKEFLKNCYPNVEIPKDAKDFPISLIRDKYDISDSDILGQKVEKGELRICFAVPFESDANEAFFEPQGGQQRENYFEQLEAATRFALNKRTVGRSLAQKDLLPHKYNIEICASESCAAIFNGSVLTKLPKNTPQSAMVI